MKEADVEGLLAQLREGLHESGFDLLTPFLVSWYNEEEHIVNLPAVHKLPAEAGCLAVIVGNSRALWAPFLAWTRTQLEADPTWLESHPHALDCYTEEKMQQALARPDLPASDVIYAAETLETTGRAISVTTAAHVSSLAFYHQTAPPASNTCHLERVTLHASTSPCAKTPTMTQTPHQIQRSVHPVLGPWIAYRAVVVFPELRPGSQQLPRPSPPVDPCSAAEWEKVRELQDECFAKWAPDNPDGSETDWARLVEVVEVFEAGREHAYSADQLAFHYSGHDEPGRVEHLRRCATRSE